MKTKILILTFLSLSLCLISLGQNKVLLTNGQTFNSIDIKSGKSSVDLSNDSIKQTIQKKDILCVIPEKGKCFTYKMKNSKTLKLARKFATQNTQGVERARLFARKYYGTKANISELYLLNGDKSISEADFTKEYKKTQSRITTSNVLAIGAFIIGLSSFIGALSAAAAL